MPEIQMQEILSREILSREILSREILSQDEIDALLSAVGSGNYNPAESGQKENIRIEGYPAVKRQKKS